jgi:hypothetical protein
MSARLPCFDQLEVGADILDGDLGPSDGDGSGAAAGTLLCGTAGRRLLDDSKAAC